MTNGLNPNLGAFNLAVSTLLKNPANLLPNLTISTFLHLPEQLGPHLVQSKETGPSPSSLSTSSLSSTVTGKALTRTPTINALVIDKDNTLTPPEKAALPPLYYAKLHSLRTSPSSPFNLNRAPHSILIVSNTAGSDPRSAQREAEAQDLEDRLAGLQIPVFRVPVGARKKPLCGAEVLDWFRERGVVRGADEIAVVGDRLGTDVLMARQMGAWSVWTRDGVTVDEAGKGCQDYRGLLAQMETLVEKMLRTRGLQATVPQGWER